MKITCEREKLLAAFQSAASVAPNRSPKPVLQNVKIEAVDDRLRLSATDLEVAIQVGVTGAKILAPGSALLPVGRFGMIVRESTDETLNIEADSRGTSVVGEHAEFRLQSEAPEGFPEMTAFTEAAYYEVPARLLRELIRRTVFAADPESSRFALGGVLLEFTPELVTAVGTDGRRLAVMEGPAVLVGENPKTDLGTIVPMRSMQLIERVLSDDDAEVRIASRENDVIIKSMRATIYSRLVEGRFPRWRDVFPDVEKVGRIELLNATLHSAVRQAAIATSEESRGVLFDFDVGKLVLSGHAAEVGDARVEVPIAYDGPRVSIKLDPKYVSDYLRVLEAGKSVTLQIKDAESAAVFTTDDGYRYVIMPLAKDV